MREITINVIREWINSKIRHETSASGLIEDCKYSVVRGEEMKNNDKMLIFIDKIHL